MKKNNTLKLLALALIIACVAFVNVKEKNLKKEYEKLNGKNYIKVSIPKDSPLINTNYNTLKKMTKKTGVIFIGTSKNQASRDSIKPLLEAADETGIDKIYYIDIKKIEKTNYNKELQIKKINIPTLITIKNGKVLEIINGKNIKNSKYKKMSKEKQIQLKEKYIKAINKILICSSSGYTC